MGNPALALRPHASKDKLTKDKNKFEQLKSNRINLN